MAKLLKILLLLALLACILIGGALYYFKKKVDYTLTPDGLVELIEKRFNCRAQIASTESDLISSLSEIRIGKLVLGPRDSVADAGTPLSERPELVEGDGIVVVDEIEFQADLKDLAKGQFSCKELLLRGLRADVLINGEGDDNLAPLFEMPAVIGGEANPDYVAPEPEVAGLNASDPDYVYVSQSTTPELDKDAPIPEAPVAESESAPKMEKAIPLPATMERAAVEGGQIVIRHAGSGTLYKFEDLKLEITNIDVDPGALDTRNRCDLRLDSRLLGMDAATGGVFLEFLLVGEGDAVPFDPSTGEFKPAASADFKVAMGSSIEGGPLLSRLGSALDVASQYGLDVLDLTSKASLSEDVQTRVKYFDSRLTFQEDLLLPLDRFMLGLKRDGWINTSENTHDMNGVIIASEALTEKAMGQVREYLKEKVGGTLADIALQTVSKPLLNQDGCLTLDFRSKDSLSEPSVTVDTPLGGIGDDIQDIAKKLLKDSGGIKGLLKGLLDR